MSDVYRANRIRGPLNAAGFSILDGAVNRMLQERKQRVFSKLPNDVLVLGPGIGANFRYMRPGSRVVAIEPNPAMHARLRAQAERFGIALDLRGTRGESLDVCDESVAMVISTLVLCTVASPEKVVAEVLRVLCPGGRFAFVEHVAAAEGTGLRRFQHLVRRPWAWMLEGCSCERDLARVIQAAGFATVDIESYRLRTLLTPASTQIAGVATKAG